MISTRIMAGIGIAATALGIAASAAAQEDRQPLRIVITEGVIEPMPFAVPDFIAENLGSEQLARDIARLVADDLRGTGLFREVPEEAHIGKITSFSAPVSFPNWKAINVEALVTGSVNLSRDRQLEVKFNLFDVYSGNLQGTGLKFVGDSSSWRRIGHKIADVVYSRITGESGYFDSRVAFISESGPKDNRRKQLAVMDYDGANLVNLTGDDAIVLAPRFSPDGTRLLYTSYETGSPHVYLMDIGTRRRSALLETADMTFAPRFSPDGSKVLLSRTRRGNTDIYEIELETGTSRRLTSSVAIDTAPSYSPDGKWIAFESDRSNTQQLYVMDSDGGNQRRISFGTGRYGTPVWSPRGDYIAFTKQSRQRFHIGVMRTDGSEERLLTASFLDEGPTWSPNGRVIMFFREPRGAEGGPALYTVDLTGRSLSRLETPQFASDPNWSPLRN